MENRTIKKIKQRGGSLKRKIKFPYSSKEPLDKSKTEVTNIRNETRDIITDFANIERLMRKEQTTLCT